MVDCYSTPVSEAFAALAAATNSNAYAKFSARSYFYMRSIKLLVAEGINAIAAYYPNGSSKTPAPVSPVPATLPLACETFAGCNC